MTKKSMTILACLLLFFSIKTNAQIKQTIRGVIIDRETQEPLFGANVVVKTLDPVIGTTTDFDGSFTLNNIPTGRHTLQITYLGYDIVNLSNLELKGAKQLVLNIGMVESVINTAEVIVLGKKRQDEAINELATVSAQEFKVEQAERFAGSLNDVARMAQNYAGAQASDDSRNDIVVRGNSPSGVLYRLDDIDIPNPNHFAALGTAGGPVSILNTNNLSNSDFMTSAFPAEYSNASSGVFDIHLKNGNNQKHEFMAQIGFNGLEIGSEGPLSKKLKFSYIINYRYSILGLIKKLGVDFGAGAAVPNYQDLNLKLNFPYKNGAVSIWAIGGLSDIAFLDSEKEEGDTDLYSSNFEDLRFGSNMGAIGITHLHRFNKKTFFKTIASVDVTTSKADLDKIDTTTLKPYDFYAKETLSGKGTLRLVFNHKLNSRHLIQAGLTNQLKFYSLQDSVLTNDTTFVKLSNGKGNTLLSQAYIQWQYKITKKLKLNAGINSQYLTLNNTFAVEPRIGIKWQVHNKHSLTFGYGLHSQTQPLEVYFKETRNQKNKANFLTKQLAMSKSHHFVLGYNWDFLKNTHLKTEIYYQLLYDIPVEKISSSFSMINTGGSFKTILFDELENTGTGYNYGIEITIEKYLNKGWYLLFNTSLYQSKYKGSDGVERNTAYNGNYTFNLLGGKEFIIKPKKKDKKINLSILTDAKVVFTGGNRYVPIDLAASQLAGEAVYDDSKAYEEKYRDYFRADFNIGYKMSMKKVTAELTFSLQNLTNQQNIFIEEYNATKGEIDTKYQTGISPMAIFRFLF